VVCLICVQLQSQCSATESTKVLSSRCSDHLSSEMSCFVSVAGRSPSGKKASRYLLRSSLLLLVVFESVQLLTKCTVGHKNTKILLCITSANVDRF